MNTLTARTPSDLINAAQVVLGFRPSESLVMLTFGPTPFHARIDLPRTPENTAEVASMLAHACASNGAERVVLVVFSRTPVDRFTTDAVAMALTLVNVAIIGAFQTDDTDVWRVDRPGAREPLTTPPFVAEAIANGRDVTSTREDLAARIAPRDTVDLTTGPLLTDVATECVWAHQMVSEARVLNEADLAHLITAINLNTAVRDAALAAVTRATAAGQVDFWCDVVRRTPANMVTATATLLGFTAWQAGNGALAWIAVDRANEAGTDYPLTNLLSTTLENAVPPHAWDPVPLASILASV